MKGNSGRVLRSKGPPVSGIVQRSKQIDSRAKTRLQTMSSSQSTPSDEHNVSSKAKKKTSRKEKQVFCFCRQPEGNRFMIGCDKCDEWYHGDCVSITRAMGKQIHQYYCKACIAKDPTLVITYQKKETDESITKRCIECMNCLRLIDCGECLNCKNKRGRCIFVPCLNAELIEAEKKEAEMKTSDKKQPSNAKSVHFMPASPAKLDEIINAVASTSRSKEEEMGKSGKTVRGKKAAVKKEKQEKVVKGKGREVQKQLKEELGDRLKRGTAAYGKDVRLQSVSPRKESWKTVQCPTRCLARGCPYFGREGTSKYCSDECGMALARERIMAHLPKGAQNYWRIEPVAVKELQEEEMRRKEEELELSKEMENLDKWYALCINFVEAIKNIKPDEKEDDHRVEADMSMSCPVCAAEYTCKTISRHLEKCFAKQEKQSTYGTSTKYAVNPNNIFCEEFNKSNNTYCKRLRVICPEHYKGDIEAGLEVCGWPKAWSQPEPLTMEGMFTSVEDIISLGTCGISRKECKQHSGWIPAILGTIDSRRMAHFTRMDELLDISVRNQKRGDAILLMCNQTEYHQPLEKIIASYNEGRSKSTVNVVSTVL